MSNISILIQCLYNTYKKNSGDKASKNLGATDQNNCLGISGFKLFLRSFS